MTAKAGLVFAILALSVALTSTQSPRSEAILPVSPNLPQLPPPPAGDNAAVDPPPPPPVQPGAVPVPPPPPVSRHLDVVLDITAAFRTVWRDCLLPAGRITSIKWVAVGAGNANVTSSVEVRVWSPSIYIKPLAIGGTDLAIDPPGANVRVLAGRIGTFPARVTVSIDMQDQ